MGDSLGGYRLCVQLGTGGMATVYLAQATSHSGVPRFVALKCIRPELASDARFVDMFHDEAALASQIHHPNVCSVIDFDEAHGTHYLVLEFLSGHTLTAIHSQLASAPDDPARFGVFAKILESACEGLHAAHEAVTSDGTPLHVVHRDVSPDNLMVTFDGNVKVMDFGVAYATDHHHATRTGFLKGKCRYLAPEVLSGTKPDRRADIWGLGVVAWELLTGRKLFDQDNDLAILRAVAEQDIPAPSTLRPGVPAALDEIVLRALHRDPEQRYQTARELGRAWVRFAADQGQSAGTAEVADFMRTLFPDGETWARQLFKFAELRAAPPRPRSTTSKQLAPVANPELIRELTRRSTVPDGTPGIPSELPRAAEPPAPAAPASAPLVHPAIRPWWRPRPLVAAVAAGVFACVLVTILAVRVTAASPAPPAMPRVTPDYQLEVTPAGVDGSGGVLLRVRILRPGSQLPTDQIHAGAEGRVPAHADVDR